MSKLTFPGRADSPTLDNALDIGRILLSLVLVTFTTWVGLLVFFEIVTTVLL